MSRPSKGANRLSHTIGSRLTEAEYAEIVMAAEAEGQTPATYWRDLGMIGWRFVRESREERDDG